MMYKIKFLEEKSDEELLDLLRSEWELAPGAPMEVIGKLDRRESAQGNPISYLRELRSVADGRLLTYPVDHPDVRHSVYVAPRDADSLGGDDDSGTWIRAIVGFSPVVERRKHNNPLALKALNGTLRRLKDVPEGWPIDSFQLGDKRKIESYILEVYEQKHRNLLEQQRKQFEEETHSLSTEQERLDAHVSALRTELDAATVKRDALLEQAGVAKDTLETTLAELAERSELMEAKLRQLADFARQRAAALVALDLIEEADLKTLLGESADASAAERIGHDFESVLGSDFRHAAAYVQTYLYRKGIFYRRSVLNDFLALLRTNDLIILAGDSGSGKTNLVKSFAEAIGGRSVIVPVKPNWTSSEDLLGYYNPIEKRYLSTAFLDALLEAARHPDIPYLICLDEMNLARVEYYFADFLSLLEERMSPPQIHLYSSNEESHAKSEYNTFLQLIDEARSRNGKEELSAFVDLLKDDEVNATLQKMCGFQEGDSLLKHHARLRRLLSSFVNSPSSLPMPQNVRIIGAINVDETTHYLSPKILDRVHVMRFESPLMHDWDALASEIEEFEFDVSLPLKLSPSHLGLRAPYPDFDHQDELAIFLVQLAKDYLHALGVEFGLRTVRQARCYANELRNVGATESLIKNNVVLHKVLPKLTFDGRKAVSGGRQKKDVLGDMRVYLEAELEELTPEEAPESCIAELDRVIFSAEANDWVVNYWSR